MAELYKNFINGKWVEAKSGKTFENRNPADRRDLIGLFPASGPEDVEEAVSAARKAFGEWRLAPAPKRGEILYRVGELLRQRKEEIARAMTREMGKVLKETRGDVQEGIDTAYYTAGEGRRLFGETTPSELPDKFAMSLRVPVGVCGLITPWNFPMAIPTWKIFPALLCGDTVVLKPAEDTPHTAVKLFELLEEAGVPPGVANLVHGVGEDAGAALVRHRDVRLISFTGSAAVGREIAAVCGQSLKRVSLEMGGKNGQIVMEDADLKLALEGALWGAFGTTGQRCTATSRLILHRQIKKELTDMLVERAEKIKIGDGLDESVEMGPLINEAAREKVHGYVQIGKEEGARLLTGGTVYEEGKRRQGYFYRPTLFDRVTPDMRIAQEEIFGPVLSVIEVQSFEQAIEVLNGTPYGLSSSIYTRDVGRAFRALRDIEAGITYINGPTIGAEVHLPFGGVKETGNGHREAGTTVYDIFSEWKSVYIDYSGRLQKAQIDNVE
ncbi:MAG TPA: aldehyde dehydrogenase [Deltaproteobacteria bacterium]|nr:MAG: aldehyde dehydrogenase [Deltaproteobacteria bacterium GWD2_55_8]HBA39301.1 aldehyde dehydrogenase [Deltaproteobacteria bacterium]